MKTILILFTLKIKNLTKIELLDIIINQSIDSIIVKELAIELKKRILNEIKLYKSRKEIYKGGNDE